MKYKEQPHIKPIKGAVNQPKYACHSLPVRNAVAFKQKEAKRKKIKGAVSG